MLDGYIQNFHAVPYDAIYHMTKISDSSSDCVVKALQEGGTWGLRCQEETTSAVWGQRGRKHPRLQSMRTLSSYLNVHNVIKPIFLWYLVPQTPNIRCTHSTSFTYILADRKCHHLLLWECISAGLSLFHSFFWTGPGSGDCPASKRGIRFVTSRNVDTVHDNAPLEATIRGNYWKQNSGTSTVFKNLLNSACIHVTSMLAALPADVLMAPGSCRENTDVPRLPDIVSDKLDLAARGCTESRCGHTADKYALEDTVGTICTQHSPSQNSS